MRVGRALLVALLLGASRPALAAETGVEIEAWGDAYPDGDPELHGWFRETLWISAAPAKHLFLRAALVIERDSRGEISRSDLYQDDDRRILRSATRFRDLIVGVRSGPVTFEVGKQRLTWGRASFINATDNLTPRDWTDPLDEVRLSPWSARLSVERGRAWGEAALVPRYAPSRLPILGERWFVVDPGFPATVAYGSDDLPPVSWETLQGAARGGYRGSRGEGTLSYFRGFDDAAVIVPRLGAPAGPAAPMPVFLDRSAARLEVAGLDGEVFAGSWTVRGEAGYFHYPRGERDGFLLYEVEAEFSRARWRAIAGFGDTLGNEGDPAVTALDYAFLPAAFLRGSYGEATEWQVAVDAAIGTSTTDGFVRLSGSYPFAGHLRAGAELTSIWGEAGSFFGRWRANDRLRLFLRAAF